ncbi:hypothetical protein D3C75_899960 [compost metagenome]
MTAGIREGQILVAGPRHLYMKINTVQQGSGYPGTVVRHFQRGAGAGIGGRFGSEKPAWTRIHRSREQNICRVGICGPGAPDGYLPVLQGLAHGLQRQTGELRQLIKKQHAVMG